MQKDVCDTRKNYNGSARFIDDNCNSKCVGVSCVSNMTNRGPQQPEGNASPKRDCNENSLKLNHGMESVCSGDYALSKQRCRNPKPDYQVFSKNNLLPEHSACVCLNRVCRCSSSFNQIKGALQRPVSNHFVTEAPSYHDDTTESARHTSAATSKSSSSFNNNVQASPSCTHNLVTSEFPLPISSNMTSEISMSLQTESTLKSQHLFRMDRAEVFTKCLLTDCKSPESVCKTREYASSDCDRAGEIPENTSASGRHTSPIYNSNLLTTKQIPEDNEIPSKTSNVPTIIIVDEESDQTSDDTIHHCTPEQFDHARLYPSDTNCVTDEPVSEFEKSVTFRRKPNIFTFDHISEENEDTATEGSLSPPLRKFNPQPLNAASPDSDEGKVSDLVRLKAMTARLNLTTRRQSYIAWKEEYLDKPLLARYRPQVSGSDVGWSAERKEEINNAIEWLKRELMEMKKNDQELARILVSLRHEIRQMKLQKTCDEHREMLDDLEDQMAERGEMSQLCDLPTDPMSPAPLKNVGVTRMNISTRRFSVF